MKQLIHPICTAAIIAISFMAATPGFTTSTSTDDWYLHIDVNAVRTSEMLSELEQDKKRGIAIMSELIGPALTNKLAYLSIRGNINDDGYKLLLAQGDFDNAADKQQITEKIDEAGFRATPTKGVLKLDNEAFKQYLEASFESLRKKGLIDADDDAEIEIRTEASEASEIYLGFQNSRTIVISNNLDSIIHLINDDKHWEPSSHSGLFEVVVDIEKALMHGGVNIDSATNNFEFESISAKQLKQFSATYKENSGYVELQVGLRCANDETASQIEAIARGLIALQSMSLDDPKLKRMLNNAIFLRDGNDLSLKIEGSIDDFKSLKNKVGIRQTRQLNGTSELLYLNQLSQLKSLSSL